MVHLDFLLRSETAEPMPAGLGRLCMPGLLWQSGHTIRTMAKLNRTFLKWLIVVGLFEGTSTLVLFLVAMPMKYLGDMPMAVTIAGSIHGVLFVALVGLFVLGRTVVPLTNGLMWIGILGAIVPFGPFLVDIKLMKMLELDKS